MATKLFQSQRTSANNDDDPLPTNFKKMSTEDPTEGIAVRKELESYLNKRMRIAISDGRVIDGLFLCTDRDCNIVLGNCEEFLSQEEVDEYERNSSEKTVKFLKQPRTLSLAIVPGGHIVSIALAKEVCLTTPTSGNTDSANTETDAVT